VTQGFSILVSLAKRKGRGARISTKTGARLEQQIR
jgi:hypothetical protein